MLKYLCILGVVIGARSGSAPFIKPCKNDDAACILSSAQAAVPYIAVGIPELGIKSLDPMFLDIVESEQGGLALTFKETTVKGMKECTVEAVKRDLKKNKLSVTTKCTVELTGDYSLDGQLLVLPIKGVGKYNIKIRDILIKTSTRLQTVDGADGKKHWHVDNWHYASEVKTNARFDFDNLFNGNKILADPVVTFLNTNWREVMHEIAPPVVRAIVSRVVDAVEALYKAIPIEELELK